MNKVRDFVGFNAFLSWRGEQIFIMIIGLVFQLNTDYHYDNYLKVKDKRYLKLVDAETQTSVCIR